MLVSAKPAGAGCPELANRGEPVPTCPVAPVAEDTALREGLETAPPPPAAAPVAAACSVPSMAAEFCVPVTPDAELCELVKGDVVCRITCAMAVMAAISSWLRASSCELPNSLPVAVGGCAE